MSEEHKEPAADASEGAEPVNIEEQLESVNALKAQLEAVSKRLADAEARAAKVTKESIERRLAIKEKDATNEELSTRVAALEEQAANAEREATRLRLAKEYSLPDEAFDILGEDLSDEKVKAFAELLNTTAATPPAAAANPTPAPAGGRTPLVTGNGDDISDLIKRYSARR